MCCTFLMASNMLFTLSQHLHNKQCLVPTQKHSTCVRVAILKGKGLYGNPSPVTTPLLERSWQDPQLSAVKLRVAIG